MATTIDLYTILRDRLGEDGSRAIVEALEDAKKESKTEYKDYLHAIILDMTTKADLRTDVTRLEAKIEKFDTEMKGEFKNIRLEMKLYFLVLAFLIILSNPRALDLISKLLGIVK
ncbi:MAG: hypothetical protein H7844_14595 [Nitrospirae bacterium YQR-1]